LLSPSDAGLVVPHVGTERDLKRKKGGLKQVRKGLHDSVEIPSDKAVEHHLSETALPSFLLRAATTSLRLIVSEPLPSMAPNDASELKG
jgi:hypothetical protein